MADGFALRPHDGARLASLDEQPLSEEPFFMDAGGVEGRAAQPRASDRPGTVYGVGKSNHANRRNPKRALHHQSTGKADKDANGAGAGAAAPPPSSSAPSPRGLAISFHSPPPPPHHARRYAALDLGTNNCRLLIARPEGTGFAVIDAFSRIVRLGEGLGASGRLSDAAIERAIEALRICGDKLIHRGVSLSRAVATEACRRAANGAEFVDRVYHETGIALEIIPTREEARLAMTGCHMLVEPGPGEAMIIDIGGGSTELVRVRHPHSQHPEIIDWISIPWGVVSLAEATAHDSHDPRARHAAYQQMRALPAEAIAGFVSAVDHRNVTPRLLGTSGTVTTLGSLYLGLEVYDRRRVDGLIVPTEALRALCADLAEMPVEMRANFASIGAERADLVIAGCAILETVLDHWPAQRVGVADRGIREGILRALIAIGERGRG